MDSACVMDLIQESLAIFQDLSRDLNAGSGNAHMLGDQVSSRKARFKQIMSDIRSLLPSQGSSSPASLTGNEEALSKDLYSAKKEVSAFKANISGCLQRLRATRSLSSEFQKSINLEIFA